MGERVKNRSHEALGAPNRRPFRAFFAPRGRLKRGVCACIFWFFFFPSAGKIVQFYGVNFEAFSPHSILYITKRWFVEIFALMEQEAGFDRAKANARHHKPVEILAIPDENEDGFGEPTA